MFDKAHVSQDLREQSQALRKPLDRDLPTDTTLGTFLDASGRKTTARWLEWPEGDACLTLTQVLEGGSSVRELRLRPDALPALAKAVDAARRLAPPVLIRKEG